MTPTTITAPSATILGALGLVSGALSWAVITAARLGGIAEIIPNLGPVLFQPLSLAPGLMFGFVIGGFFYRRRLFAVRSYALYALASVAAYLCAFHCAYILALLLERGIIEQSLSAVFGPRVAANISFSLLAGVPAGLLGSLLLGLAAAPLLRVERRAALGSPLLAGTAAGALLPLISVDAGRMAPAFLVFFALWQAAYAASHAGLLRALQPVR